jgi:hypothetical protein
VQRASEHLEPYTKHALVIDHSIVAKREPLTPEDWEEMPRRCSRRISRR